MQRPRPRVGSAVAVRLLTLVAFVMPVSVGCSAPAAGDPHGGRNSTDILESFLLGALFIGISVLSLLAWRWLRRLRTEIQEGHRQLDQRVCELDRDLRVALKRLTPAQTAAASKSDPPQVKKPRPEDPPSWWPAERNALLRSFQSSLRSLTEATPPAAGKTEPEPSFEVYQPSDEAPARSDPGEVATVVPPYLDEDTEGLATAWNESRGQAFTATLERRGFTYSGSGGLVAVRIGLGATDVLIFPAARSDVRSVTFGKYFEVAGKGKILWVVRPARIDESQFGGEATLESVPAYEVTKGEVRLE